jgi:magnesium-transporting ATPase (P-type)
MYIGIGISGVEGSQAVNSSDFSISQFKFLTNLLLLHGLNDYLNICKVVLYSFYKNIVLTFVLFYYTIYSGYSAVSLFDSLIYNSYNIILGLPVLCFGIYDQNISNQILLKYNHLYRLGREGININTMEILFEIVQGILDATIIFYFPYLWYLSSNDIGTTGGYNMGVIVFGTTIYCVLFLSMIIKSISLTTTWNLITITSIISSIFIFALFLYLYQFSLNLSFKFYHITDQIMNNSNFWLLCILVPSTSFMMYKIIGYIKIELFPSLLDITIQD